MTHTTRLLCLFALTFSVFAGEASKPARLPLPKPNIPDNPRLQPSVVTAAGRRLLLGHTDAALSWDAEKNRLTSNKPGWWIINYPFGRIRGLEGMSRDAIARRVIGKPAEQIKNWYFNAPGKPGPEPPEPTGPAAIELSPAATIIVDQHHPKASDDNPGTTDAPLKTIQAAVDRAKPGDVIRVMPGIYRESVTFKRGGEAGKPIVLEGARDAQGRMPVITGNDLYPKGAWKPVADAPGVYRADFMTQQPGTVSCDGDALVERSYYKELKPGEFCHNRGSREANRFRVPPDAAPSEGEALDGRTWQRVRVDDEGFLDLAHLPGDAAPNAVYYAFAYVWVEPKKVNEKWDPRFPQPITKRVDVPGDFRAGRQTGSSLKAQLNLYRLWCNGDRLPSVVHMTPEIRVVPARPSRNYGQRGDRIESLVMRQGWNRLLFQLDTTRRPKRLRFKFQAPKGIDQFVSTAVKPQAEAAPQGIAPAAHITEYLVLGPFRSEPDEGTYVRLPGDRDPNTAAMDRAVRGSALITCEHDFVRVRGFEVRHGAQFQQRALVSVKGAGCLVEGCLLRESEVSGLKVSNPHDQRAAPTIVRNNWVLDTGHTGVSAQHSSTELTPENQNTTAPGRGRLVIEYNVIRRTNWAAYPPFWASGGMKLFRLTGAVIRYNEIADGFGPGIWLDWEHYNNRLEGNLITNNWSFGIGIEASPGPNLVCNNLFVGMRPGDVWFRWNILDWSTGRTWAVNNTIDGKWCDWPSWFGRKGTDGIFIGLEGGPDRRTRWQPLADRGQDRGAAAVNNLVLGCAMAAHPRTAAACKNDYSYRGSGMKPLDAEPGFVAASAFDYRLKPGEKLNKLGIADAHTALVKHDFYGLLRPNGARRSVGAFRRRAGEGGIEFELVGGGDWTGSAGVGIMAPH